MFQKIKLFLVVCIGLLLTACAVEVSVPPPPLSDSKEITAFWFISPAVQGTISAGNISVTVPSSTDITSMIANFSTTGAYVKIGSTIQESCKTPNDFTSQQTYIVTAANGSVKMYLVKINKENSTDARLSGLTLSTGNLTTGFSSATNAYAASFGNDTKTIRVTPTLSDANATIKVSVNNGDYTTVISGNQSQELSLNVGSNTVNILVTAQDNTTNQYTIAVTRAGSADAQLSSLSLSSGLLSPAFSGSVNAYSVSVANATAAVTVVPTARDANAKLSVRVNGGAYTTVASGSASGNLSIHVGMNSLGILVTAQDGTNNEYSINVSRSGTNNAFLSGLLLSSGVLTPGFSPAINAYSASVANAVAGMTVTPAKSDANATVRVRINSDEYQTVNSGSPSQELILNIGINKIDVQVTAQDASVNEYSVTVTRAASSNARLAWLAVSAGTLLPGFSAMTNDYTASVDNGTSSITVTPKVSDVNATILVRVNNGPFAAVASEEQSGILNLNVGTNIVTLLITAQDSSTCAYSLTVTRAGSNNAKLSDLTVSSGTLIPGFHALTKEYSASVENAVSSISVTPAKNDENSTIHVCVNNGSYTAVNSGNASAAMNLQTGINTVSILVTAQDNSTNVYSISVTRAKSSDAKLANLTISAGSLSPSFSPANEMYSASVANGTSAISFIPTVNEANATIQARVNGGNYTSVSSGSASGAMSLTAGDNTVDFLVTAQDGSVKSYTIAVTRAYSANSLLSSLTLSSGTLSPAFTGTTAAYTSTVNLSVPTLKLTPVVQDGTAGVQVRVNSGSFTAVGSGALSPDLPLNEGANTVEVLITAQNGATRTYSIIVTRAASSNADLSGLWISAGTLSPSFSRGTTAYTASVSSDVSLYRISPSLADAYATCKFRINEGPYTAYTGGTTDSMPLNLRGNTIDILVTAQDGSEKTYTLAVTRVPSNIATLSALVPSIGTFSTAFSPTTVTYSLTVPSSTSSVSFRITPAQYATVQASYGGGSFQDFPSGALYGNYPISQGITFEIRFKVTAQDGTEKTYTINVISPSNDAYLDMMTSSIGYMILDGDTTGFSTTVASTVQSLTVTPLARHAKATIAVRIGFESYANVISGGTSSALYLNDGNNQVNIKITAEDGTVKTYTLTVKRLSRNASLDGLAVTSGIMSPSFNSSILDYSMSKSINSGTIAITPSSMYSFSTLQYKLNSAADWTPIDSGSASIDLEMRFGPNQIYIKVTSEDGTASKTYCVSVFVQIWNKVFNGNGTESPSASVCDPTGNLYLALNGTNLLNPASKGDIQINKYDNGSIEIAGWNKTIDFGNSNDSLAGMAMDSAGYLYIAGTTDFAGTKQSFVKKYSSDGTEITAGWDKTITNGGNYINITSIAVDSGDNVILGGYGYRIIGSSSGDDWWIRKYNSSGTADSAFNITEDNGAGGMIHSITTDPVDNSLYVCGTCPGLYLKKYTSAGLADPAWNKYLGAAYSYGTAVKVDAARNVYLTGYGWNLVYTNSSSDWFIKKYSASGTEDTANWNKKFDYGPTANTPGSLAVDAGGNVFVAGNLNGFAVKKFSSGGVEDTSYWAKAYGYGNATTLAVSAATENVFVGGTAINRYSLTSGNDWTITQFNKNGFEQ